MALIDGDVLIKEFESNPTDGLYTNEIVAVVREAPEVDPIQAAGGCYCWECERNEKGHCLIMSGRSVVQMGFCGYGSRREGADG